VTLATAKKNYILFFKMQKQQENQQKQPKANKTNKNQQKTIYNLLCQQEI
jgi:hypothetical protein